MLKWITALFDPRSKSELLDHVAAQHDLIRHLLGNPVRQLAKLAWRLHEASESSDFFKAAAELDDFAEDHAAELRCLEGGGKE